MSLKALINLSENEAENDTGNDLDSLDVLTPDPPPGSKPRKTRKSSGSRKPSKTKLVGELTDSIELQLTMMSYMFALRDPEIGAVMDQQAHDIAVHAARIAARHEWAVKALLGSQYGTDWIALGKAVWPVVAVIRARRTGGDNGGAAPENPFAAYTS